MTDKPDGVGPDDVCFYHSPKLKAAEARVAELEAENARLRTKAECLEKLVSRAQNAVSDDYVTWHSDACAALKPKP